MQRSEDLDVPYLVVDDIMLRSDAEAEEIKGIYCCRWKTLLLKLFRGLEGKQKTAVNAVEKGETANGALLP